MNSRQKILNDIKHYSGTTIIGQAVLVVRSILLPILFSPAQLGIWNMMFVILNYSANAHLGLLHGMNKEIPQLRGKGKIEEISSIKASVFWFIIFLGLILFFALFTASFFVAPSFMIAIRIVSFIVFLQLIFNYFFCVLRADAKFKLTSKGILIFTISSSFGVLLLAFFSPNHLTGGLIGLGIAHLFVLTYWLVKGKFRFSIQLKRKSILGLFIVGTPLILIGVLDSLIISIDRWVIITNFNTTELGYYALGIMVSGLIGIIPSSVSSVLYTRMLERFAINNKPEDIDSLFFVPMRFMWGLMLVLISVSVIMIPLLISLFIPKYLLSIPIIEIFVFGAFFISTTYIPTSYLITNNKQRGIILIQVVTGIFIFLIDSIMVYKGYGLIGIAFGTISGYAIYGLGYTIFAISISVKNRSSIILLIVKQLIPFIILVLSFIAVNHLFLDLYEYIGQIWTALFKLTLMGCILLTSLWLANRDGVVLAFVMPEIKYILNKIRN